MIFKGIVLVAAVSAVLSKPITPSYLKAGYQYQDLEEQEHNYHAPAKYRYSYGVEDYKTGDFKTHKEERDGDTVNGQYTMAYEDGSIYTVTYTVDKDSGYKAVVTKTNEGGHVKVSDHGFTENNYKEESVNPESKNYYKVPVPVVKREQPKLYYKPQETKMYKTQEETHENYEAPVYNKPKIFSSLMKLNDVEVKTPIYTKNIKKYQQKELLNEPNYRNKHNIVSIPTYGENQYEIQQFEDHPASQVDYLF